MKQKKASSKGPCTALATETRSTSLASLCRTYGAVPYALYDELRLSVPLIDAAIRKIIRLVGGFEVKGATPAVTEELNTFLKTVPVGCSGQGIGVFLNRYLDSLITYGTAVGEIVVGDVSGAVRGLYNADLRELDLEENPSGMGITLRVKGNSTPVDRPDLILYSALDPTTSHPLGHSLLAGLPFVSAVLGKIFDSIGTNFERMGNMRFAVTYKPDASGLEGAFAADRAAEIAREWTAAMSDTSAVKDFVAVGDVDIKVIGADSPVLDTEIPVRQMLEQIIAKLGLPPFFLGLSWSSTERMAREQTDLFTTELWHYRHILEPVIERICETYLRREGLPSAVDIQWDDISLIDEVEAARARLIHAQAAQIEQTKEPCNE